MTVQRRFKPETAALDELVEVLYSLLVELPGDLTETAVSSGEPDLLPVRKRATHVVEATEIP
jgi:hypothetical protein